MSDYYILIILALGGIPVLIAYWYMFMLARDNRATMERYWAKLPYVVRYIDMFTMLFAAASGIYLIYYSIDQIPNQSVVVHHAYDPYGRIILYTAWILFLLGANLWAIGMIREFPKGIIIASLVITAAGVSLLMDCVLNGQIERTTYSNEFILAIVSSSILLFQTGILDLVVWGYYFIFDNEL